MKGFRVFLVLAAVAAFSVFVYAGKEGDEALNRLMDGNKHFSSDKLVKVDIGDKRRKELTKGQHPAAIVLACSDSRVAPELIFNKGLGDIFVIRVAGNIVDKLALGSIEYGAEHLHAPLLVILGHQSCGAVKATMEAQSQPEGNIGEILKKIMPAVLEAKAAGKGAEETLDLAVQENAKNVYREILDKSPIIEELVHKGELKVVVAEYYLDSGKVKILE